MTRRPLLNKMPVSKLKGLVRNIDRTMAYLINRPTSEYGIPRRISVAIVALQDTRADAAAILARRLR